MPDLADVDWICTPPREDGILHIHVDGFPRMNRLWVKTDCLEAHDIALLFAVRYGFRRCDARALLPIDRMADHPTGKHPCQAADDRALGGSSRAIDDGTSEL